MTNPGMSSSNMIFSSKAQHENILNKDTVRYNIFVKLKNISANNYSFVLSNYINSLKPQSILTMHDADNLARVANKLLLVGLFRPSKTTIRTVMLYKYNLPRKVVFKQGHAGCIFRNYFKKP